MGQWRAVSVVYAAGMSSAGIPTLNPQVEPVPGELPERPDAGTLMGVVFAGALVLVMSALSAGALSSGLYVREAREWVGVVAFSLLPGLILFGAARYWWRALRSTSRDRARWIPLLLPFFVVVCASAGVAFVQAAYAAAHDDRSPPQQIEGASVDVPDSAPR